MGTQDIHYTSLNHTSLNFIFFLGYLMEID